MLQGSWGTSGNSQQEQSSQNLGTTIWPTSVDYKFQNNHVISILALSHLAEILQLKNNNPTWQARRPPPRLLTTLTHGRTPSWTRRASPPSSSPSSSSSTDRSEVSPSRKTRTVRKSRNMYFHIKLEGLKCGQEVIRTDMSPWHDTPKGLINFDEKRWNFDRVMHQARLVASEGYQRRFGHSRDRLTECVLFLIRSPWVGGVGGKKEYAEHVSHAGGMWPCANCRGGPTLTECKPHDPRIKLNMSR